MPTRQRKYISLPAHGRKLTIGQYVSLIKRVKANVDARFSSGLTQWWPCFGRDIVQEFRKGVQDRINQHIPSYGEGRRWTSIYQTELVRDCQNIRKRVQRRVILRQIMTPELRTRFSGLLFEEEG